MEPVDPTEAPDYYKVIKEPMGKFCLILATAYIFCVLEIEIEYNHIIN